MHFQIHGLDAALFRNLYGLDDDELAARGVKRYRVDAQPGFPCRVSLADLEVGEAALLLNFEHQPAPTPYRSRHAIFVGEGAQTAVLAPNEVPEQLRIRTLSIRSFDADGMMVDAELADGQELEHTIGRLLSPQEVAYLHIHNAGRGCYAARVTRAGAIVA